MCLLSTAVWRLVGHTQHTHTGFYCWIFNFRTGRLMNFWPLYFIQPKSKTKRFWIGPLAIRKHYQFHINILIKYFLVYGLSLSSRQYIICNTSKLNVQSNRFYIDFVPWIKSTNRSVDNGDSFSHQKAFFFQIHFTIRWRWCGMEWAPFQLVCCVRWRSSCLPIIIWKIWFWVWRNLWNRVTILQLSFRCRFMQKKNSSQLLFV